MRVYLITLGVILCAVYAHSESRQYYPGVGYINTGNRGAVQTSSRLRAAPLTNQRNVKRTRAARLRDEYELIEREELSPNRRRYRPNTRNTNRRSSARRPSTGRRYRLARNEAATIAPSPASEPIASPSVAIPPQPSSSSSSSSSSSPSLDSSPVRAFGGIFPNFQGGNGGSVTGGGYAQTNGPGAAFAAGFAQSSGSNSFAGGFGAVIQHPRFPKFGPNGNGKPVTTNRDIDSDNSSKDDDSGFEDAINSEDADR